MAERIDRRRRTPGSLIPAARVIAATFALQQALPAAVSGDQALEFGLLTAEVSEASQRGAGGSQTSARNLPM